MDKRSWETALVERFPLCLRLFYTGAKKGEPFWGCQVWGFECGEGWHDLLVELLTKIEAMIKALPEEDREDFYAVQVKEKFGTLRFYMSQETDAMDKAIMVAEDKSALTCERCGAPGKCESSGGWWATRCDKCKQEEMNVRT